MTEVQEVSNRRYAHGHNQITAAIFAGSLIVGAALVIAAELMKPERYEFHPGATATSYIIYDKDTGRATTAEFGSTNPIAALEK